MGFSAPTPEPAVAPSNPLRAGDHRGGGASSAGVSPAPEERLLAAFRRASGGVPSYRTLLEEHCVDAGEVVDAASFSRLCPVLTKANTLLRYQTGDVAALLDHERVAEAAMRHGLVLPGVLPFPPLALKGRDRDALPNGSHVGVYKDALYADHGIAARLTGAVRLIFNDGCCTMHVQLTPAAVADPSVERTIAAAVPSAARPARVVVWPYAQFPFGMTLDYERKFSHYVPGERDTD